jgi:N-acetylglucosaminyldiphosphoundecaprenol N-acetyl-beta-D-mannosaminyltransferase
MLEQKSLIAINISIGKYSDFITRISELGIKRRSSYVCIANVHMLVEAYNSNAFANVVNSADIVTPDGMPLAKGLKLIYGIDQPRVAGMDLLPDLLQECTHKNISVFFYGGTQSMLDRTVVYVREKFQNLNVAGMYSPPFRELTPEEEKEIIDKINGSNAGILIVALGCPKQERWMASMKGRINACMLGVGGALPVMVGMQKRAPEWMQRNSLEWLFRLKSEPGRLFKRYFVTNLIFIALFLKLYLVRAVRGTKPLNGLTQEK